MAKNDLASQIVGIIVLGIIVLAVFGYAILYHISVKLFQWFVFFYIISALATIGFGIMIFVKWDDEPEIFAIIAGISLVVFIFSVIGANVTGNFIQQIPATDEGRASLQAWDDLWFVIGIPTYVQETFKTALNQQTEEICKQYDEQICQMTKSIVNTYEDTQELQDWINKGNKLIDFVETHKK
jgi:hypothetical protein